MTVAQVVLLAGLTLAIMVILGAWAAIERGARMLIRPRPRRPDADEPGGTTVRLTVPDGVVLAGSWFEPTESSPARGVVILAHGFAEGRDALRGRAEMLTRSGWRALTIDSRAIGESGGTAVTFGVREADDLRGWTEWVAERVGSDVRIAAWGRSMGAAVAVRAAVETPGRFSALVLEAAYPALLPTVRTWLKLAVRVPTWLPLSGAILTRAGRRSGVDLLRPTPLDLARSIRVPVLVIHGTDDRLVPLADARRLAEAFDPPAEWNAVETGRHANVYDVGGPELDHRIVAFLNRTAGC